MQAAKSSIDKEVFRIWHDTTPSDAFVAGFTDCAGKVTIPSRDNIDSLRKQITKTQTMCENDSQRKLLACIDTYLAILEPAIVPNLILDAFFGHLVKEGIKPAHMSSLAEYGRHGLRAYMEDHTGRDWPVGQRMLAVIRCDGLMEILNVVSSKSRSRVLKIRVNELMGAVKEYERQVHVDGFSTGTFDEAWKVMESQGCRLDRESIYPQALRDLYDYTETPAQVEEKGLRFLNNELGDFRNLVHEFASNFGCDASAEAVAGALKSKKALKTSTIIPYINQVRKTIVKIVNKRIVGVNPRYSTKVIETPKYLSGVFPSGGAYSFDYLTKRPKQIFIATTDPHRDPAAVPTEVLNLLIHEEYGHCVHSSNSTMAYAWKPTLVEMLGSTLGSAVSEGIAFQREFEFQHYLYNMPDESHSTRDEKVFLKSCDRLGGFEIVRNEYSFYTQMFRVIRFLRVIGDARINSGKQDLADFIEWANKETGLSKSTVYFQVFPAHQGIGPGYATTYAIIGEAIREIENAANQAGKDLVKFRTFASSQGFAPRTVFESRLRDYAKT
jgi:hypothetical protein